jgi:hypothetical protein
VWSDLTLAALLVQENVSILQTTKLALPIQETIFTLKHYWILSIKVLPKLNLEQLKFTGLSCCMALTLPSQVC